jgi:hypothetical protein
VCWSSAIGLIDGTPQHRSDVVPFALGRRVAAFGAEEPGDRGDVDPTVERAPGVLLPRSSEGVGGVESLVERRWSVMVPKPLNSTSRPLATSLAARTTRPAASSVTPSARRPRSWPAGVALVSQPLVASRHGLTPRPTPPTPPHRTLCPNRPRWARPGRQLCGCQASRASRRQISGVSTRVFSVAVPSETTRAPATARRVASLMATDPTGASDSMWAATFTVSPSTV